MNKRIKKRIGFFKKIGNEFKQLALRSSFVDLAIGVIIGASLQTIIRSFVNDIVMPIIAFIVGSTDFSTLFWEIKKGGPTIYYGVFLTNVLNFLIMALAILLLVKFLNRISNVNVSLNPKKKCPYCRSDISAKATRCPNCTSTLTNSE